MVGGSQRRRRFKVAFQSLGVRLGPPPQPEVLQGGNSCPGGRRWRLKAKPKRELFGLKHGKNCLRISDPLHSPTESYVVDLGELEQNVRAGQKTPNLEGLSDAEAR